MEREREGEGEKEGKRERERERERERVGEEVERERVRKKDREGKREKKPSFQLHTLFIFSHPAMKKKASLKIPNQIGKQTNLSTKKHKHGNQTTYCTRAERKLST